MSDSETVEVIYKPGSGMPSHAAAHFNIKGWGSIALEPSPKVNKLHKSLADIIIKDHPTKVFLYSPELPPEIDVVEPVEEIFHNPETKDGEE
jgi:hypothetical protein